MFRVLREAALGAVLLGAGMLAPPVWAQSEAGNADLLAGLRPVTDEMLANPQAGNWLIWRRTYGSSGFSPLDEINTENVDQLVEVWRAPLADGSNMATPLMHDGVIFLADVDDIVLALDAATGAELWRYEHDTAELPGPEGSPLAAKIGPALYGETLIVPTLDLRLVALDFRTGEPVWEHDIAVTAAGKRQYSLRASPLVANGVVVQGVTATMVPEGGFILGLDAASGEELWRFQTVAGPEDPQGHTWNNIDRTERQGGSVWIPGSYDPELDLVYFGTAPTYHTAPLLDPADIPGVTNDALYTNTTVALRPRSGELVWHFQHVANDQWDLDWSYERQVVELPVDGGTRRAVVNAGKMALYDALDAATGDYLFSVDVGLQNLVAAINPETGTKTMNANARPNAESEVLVCPFAVGGRNWQSAALNPQSKMLFLPLAELCMTAGPIGQGGNLLTTGVQMTPVSPPGSNGYLGRMQAINLATGELAWNHREPMPPTSGALATEGGLVFVADLNPSLKALDQADGELLWSVDLPEVAASFPISFSVGDKQHVALAIGQAGLHASSLVGISSQVNGPNPALLGSLAPGGAALVVYALP